MHWTRFAVLGAAAIALTACSQETTSKPDDASAGSASEAPPAEQVVITRPEVPICEALPITESTGFIILCGGGPSEPVVPDKPDKPDPPTKPDKPDKPDRTQYIEADRVMTEKTIREIEKGSLPAPDKQRIVGTLREHHARCVSGRERCVGEP